MIPVTIGVMAYNEELNIVQMLTTLLGQQTRTCRILEIVVIASGCTDRTVELAQAVARTNPLIRVEVQKERAGKATAINRLLSLARGEVIVLGGADILLEPTSVENLVLPFHDPTIGMTGARVVPLNDPHTFLGFTVRLLWHLHHCLALRWPKLGELVAFRKAVEELPGESATDEVALEAILTSRGCRLHYADDAVVYNRGPQTLSDFLCQRRRIFAGHLHIATTHHYAAASMSITHLLRLAVESFAWYPTMLPLIVGSGLLEGLARTLGTLDFLLDRHHHIWRPVHSTKKIHEHLDLPLILLELDYRPDTIHHFGLLNRLHRIPRSKGTVVWWDRKQGKVLFLLPADQLARPSEELIHALAGYLGGNSSADPLILDYQVVEFPPAPLPVWESDSNDASHLGAMVDPIRRSDAAGEAAGLQGGPTRTIVWGEAD